MDTTDFLNDIEREKVSHFLEDVVLREAIRKIFLKRIYVDGVLIAGIPAKPYENFALQVYKDQTTGKMYSDEELGKLTKIRRIAIELLQRGFTDLEEFKKVVVIPERVVNKAR